MSATPRSFPRHSRVSVEGVSLSVAEYGQHGEPLLLLHGIGSNGSTWWPVVDALVAHFRLIVPDWRGHGASDKPQHGYLLQNYAADLQGLLATLRLERPLIMGHSLGGMIALTWARQHPEEAGRLILEDTPLRRHPNVEELFDGWLALVGQTVAETAAHYAREHPLWSADDCLRRAQALASTHLGVFRELRDSTIRDETDRIAPLSVIQSPVLLVQGDVEHGGMVQREDAERLAATLPTAIIKRIAEGSHSLHRDHTEAFLGHILPFLGVE